MIGAPEYNLAKFLDSIIKPYIPGTYMIDSSNDLIDELQQFNFNQKHHLVSFDVASLFTNIPLRETIDIITQKIYSDKTCAPPIRKEHFTELLSIATQGMFLYKNKLYQLIDGVAMGSPLGPTLANFFLATVEMKLLTQNLDCSPKLYLRYVDDIFAIFEEEKSSSKFLEVLNHQHKNLEFTMEKSIGAFPFLDVQININENILETRIWRKPTHTGVLLNFSAACPEQWKTGLIICLLKRAKTICSTDNIFWTEVKNLRYMFHANGYPNWFFDKCVEKFLRIKAPQLQDKENVDEKKLFFSVPYVGKSSQLFTKQLSKLIANLTSVKLIPMYKTFKVGNYFNLKSRTPTPLVSNVVYRFSCPREADLTYIGKSAKHLVTRAKEHWSLNSITRKSALKEHILDCNNCVKSDDILKPFSILCRCGSDYDTKIHEALLIKKYKPKLNRQLYGNGSSFLLKIF